MNPFKRNARTTGLTRLVVVSAFAVLLAACGKDSDDGDVANALLLPTDNVLNLYCPDIGINTERCVLDDPDNPYARVSVTQDTKFDLAAAAPSPKARFYLWATALARAATGENQYNTARALYELSDASGSDFIRDHALRAYRSVLDNFLTSVTFFSTADFGVLPAVFYPVEVSQLAAADMIAGIGGTLMFDDGDPVRNEFLARNQLITWGYFYDEDSGQVTN
ncbi:MAG: hypothetical protein AAF353_08225 [Pseudomonadota bacterium]